MKIPTLLGALLAMAACVSSDGHPGRSLTDFGVDVPVVGRVTENVTACEVDATCFLRLDFADTTMVVLYGLGERADPACRIPRAVSDVAFDLHAGDTVALVVAPCGTEGHVIRRFPDVGADSVGSTSPE